MGRKSDRARRTSQHVDPDQLSAINRRLGQIRVDLPSDPGRKGSRALRSLFAAIRVHRNAVQRILSTLIPKAAQLRAELILVERTLDADDARIRDSRRGLFEGDKKLPETTVKARIRLILSDWHDLRAELKSDLEIIDAVIVHARNIKEELRMSFEEASRCLASIELEYRIERSAP